MRKNSSALGGWQVMSGEPLVLTTLCFWYKKMMNLYQNDNLFVLYQMTRLVQKESVFVPKRL